MDHRQNRVHIDGALRIVLEEGAGAGRVGVAAAWAVGRHPVREAEAPWMSGIVIVGMICVSTGRTSTDSCVGSPRLRREREEVDVRLGGAGGHFQPLRSAKVPAAKVGEFGHHLA